MDPTTRAHAFKEVLVLALIGGSMTLASCSKSITPVATSSASLGSTVSSAVLAITKSSPHVVNSATVTSSIDRLDKFKKFLRSIVPDATAATTGISAIWDPNTGSQPEGTEFGVLNGYMGGGYSCSPVGSGGTAYNQCTKSGKPTISELVSLKSYMGQQLDPDFKNSNDASTTIFGRMQSALQITCALGYLLPADADGTPTVGTPTISFPTDTSNIVYQAFSSGGCGIDAGMGGQSVVPTITAVTGSSLYKKKLTLTVGNPSTLWIGLDLATGTVNFMNLEDQANASGRDAVSRTILSATGLSAAATTVLKFEYASMGFNGSRNSSPNCYLSGNWQCSYEFHRIFIDGVHDVGYLLSNNGDPGDAGGGTGPAVKYKQFSAAGRPVELAACTSSSCAETIALSVAFAGEHNVDGTSATTPDDFVGCMGADHARAISGDNTLTCSITGTTVNRGSGSGAIELSRQFYAAQTSSVPNVLTNTGDTTTVSFTNGTDIYTAATAQ